MKQILSALVLAGMPALVLAAGGTAGAVPAMAPAAGMRNAAAPTMTADPNAGITTATAPTIATDPDAGTAPTAAAPAMGVAPAVDPGAHAGPDPAELIGPPEGTPLAGAALDARTHDVAATIRCPVCQGVSVADSPSEMAQNMKRQTAELLARGYDAEQIIHYFEQSYGEFIRLEPKRDGLRSFVWIAPVLLLLVGLGVIARFVWKNRQGAAEPTPDPPTRDRLPDDPALVPWVQKARELAYGWPGGVPPKGGA